MNSRVWFSAVIAGLGVAALNTFVQGTIEVVKGGSFGDAAKEALITSVILGMGTFGATAGAIALTDACPRRKTALAKR